MSNQIDICDHISVSFDSAKRKHNFIEESIVTKLDEFNNLTTTNLNRILNHRGCQSTIVPDSLSEVSEKIEQLEKQLDEHELQQKMLQSRNEEQLKMLHDINALLTKHHDKFENFGIQVPNLLQTPKDDAGVGDTNHILPMSYVLGLTQYPNKGKK